MSNRKLRFLAPLLLLPLLYFTPLPTIGVASMIHWGLKEDYSVNLDYEEVEWSGSQINFIKPRLELKKRLYNQMTKPQPLLFKVLLSLFDISFTEATLLTKGELLSFNALISNKCSSFTSVGCDLTLKRSICGQLSNFPLSLALDFLPEEIISIGGSVSGQLSEIGLEIEDLQLMTQSGIKVRIPQIALQFLKNDAANRIAFQANDPLPSIDHLRGELDLAAHHLQATGGLQGHTLSVNGCVKGQLFIDEIPFDYHLLGSKILLQGEVEGISLSFNAYIEEGDLHLDLSQLAGSVKNLRSLAKRFSLTLPNIPLQGLVMCRDQHIVYRGGFYGTLKGELVEGSALLPGGFTAKELQADFAIDLSSGKLDVEQLHGQLVGKHKNYSILSNALLFDPDIRSGLRFDLWLSDAKQDLVRLAGRAYGDTIEMERSHICQIKPDLFRIKLKGTDIEEVQFKARPPISAFNDELAHLFDDLSHTFYGSLLKPLKQLDQGFADLEVNYLKVNEQLTISLLGKEIAQLNGKRFPLKLEASRVNNIWTIEDLRLGHLSLSAELQELGNTWTIPYMGVDFGGLVACGLKGTYLENEARLLFTAPVMTLHCPSIGAYLDLPTTVDGTIQAKGAGSYSLKEGLTATLWGNCKEAKWGLIDASDSELELYVQGLNEINPHSFELSIDRLNLQLVDKLSLTDVKIVSDHNNVHCKANHCDIPIEAHHAWHYPDRWRILTKAGSYDIETCGHAIQSIHGSGDHSLINLNRDGDLLIGEVTLNIEENGSFIEKMLPVKIPLLGGTATLKGSWSGLHFVGEARLDALTLPTGSVAHIHTQLDMDQNHISLKDLAIVDPKVHLLAKEIDIDSNHKIEGKEVHGSHFHPSQLLNLFGFSGSFHSLAISDLHLDTFSITSLNQCTGFGRVQFTHLFPFNQSLKVSSSQADLASYLKVDPKWLLPSNGEVEFEIEPQKIAIKKFKDFYSEGKGIRFELFGDDAHILFDGSVHIPLRLKPHNLPIKWVEMVMLTLRGSLIAPSLQLSSKK